MTQVNTNAAGAAVVNRTELLCHGMSQNGTWVAFTASTGGSSPFLPGPEIEATLMLKNTRTGELLRVSPPRGSLPKIQKFTFGSITPDGSRVRPHGLRRQDGSARRNGARQRRRPA